MIKKFLAACCLLAVFLGSGVANAQTPATAAPPVFTVGDTWVFQDTEFNKVTFFVDTVQSVNDKEVVFIRRSTERPEPRPVTYTVDGNTPATSTRTFPLALVFPLKVGAEWAGRSTSGGRTHSDITKVIGYGKIQTPAGEFDAYQIERNSSTEGRPITSRQVYWWAPQLNRMILRDHKTRGGDNEQFTEVLVGYSVTVGSVVKSNFVDVPGCDFCRGGAK